MTCVSLWLHFTFACFLTGIQGPRDKVSQTGAGAHEGHLQLQWCHLSSQDAPFPEGTSSAIVVGFCSDGCRTKTSGFFFLPVRPPQPQTVVVSCEEDWQLCTVAFSASVPVVTAEFILTGILQQKLDVQTNLLSSPADIPQPVGGRGQSRRKH